MGHDHTHDHDHAHDAGADHTHENPFAGQGSVLLDIGGDVGALVVSMPRSMIDVEVEIEPAAGKPAGQDHRPHVAVVDRPVGDGSMPSLVFPGVVEGRHALFLKGEDVVRLEVEVVGGQVTEAAWPQA